jgi:hypothetical protein
MDQLDMIKALLLWLEKNFNAWSMIFNPTYPK